MKNIISIILMVFTTVLLVMAIGAGRDLVNRHYDYLDTIQDNTRVEQRIDALRAAQGRDDAATGPGAMLTITACGFGAIAVILAAAAVVGQGGLVNLLNSANKLARTAKRSRSHDQRRQLPEPDRYVVVTEPDRPQLPAPDDDDVRWT